MLAYIYGKTTGSRTYKGIDLSTGCTVDRLIFCSYCEYCEEAKKRLQSLADRNKAVGLSLQLRDSETGRVLFTTA